MASRKTGLKALAAAATMWVLLVVARAGEMAEAAAGGRGEDGDVAQVSIGNAVAGYMLSNRNILSVGGGEAAIAGAVQPGGRALLATKDDLKKKKDCKDKKDKQQKEDKEKRKRAIAQKKAALKELKKKSPSGRRYFKKIRSKRFPRGPRAYPRAPAPPYKAPKPAKSPPPPPPHKAPAPSYKAPKPAAKSPPPPHKAPAPSYKAPKPAAKSPPPPHKTPAKSPPPPPPHKTPAPSYKSSHPPPKPLSPAGLSKYRYRPRYPRSTPTPAPPRPTSAPSPTSTQKVWLNLHNAARAKKSLPALTWDNTLAKYALDWANHQKNTGNCALEHSHGPYGENLFWGYGKVWTPADAVHGWVEEEQPYYNYASNTCASGQMCGHYTQVMWRTSRRLGCAQVTCNDGSLFFICSYDPPGNYIGQKPY